MRVLGVLVLLTGVVSAFTPNPTLAGLAANTAMDLGAYTCTNPVGDNSYSCALITDYSGFTYDADNDRMLMFGGGHATTFTDALMAFSFTTLSWSALYTPTPCANMTPSNLDRTRGAWLSGPSGPFPRPISRHTYDNLIVPPGLGEFINLAECNGGQQVCPQGFDFSSSDPFFMAGRVAHYVFQSGTWTFSGTVGGGETPAGSQSYPSIAYDPPSGQVIILGRYGISTYDPVAKTKTRWVRGDWGELKDSAGNFLSDGALRGWCNLVYFPPNQRHYYFDRGYDTLKVWELQLNRSDWAKSTVTEIADTGRYPPSNESGFDYDSVNQIIGGGIANNTFYAFNPKTKGWTAKTIQGGSPGSVAFHALSYDPVNNVFIFLTPARRTWAYRYGTGSTAVRRAPAASRVPVISVSPNPFTERTLIRVNPGGAAAAVFNASGRCVARWNNINDGCVQWDASGLPAGIYLVRAGIASVRTVLLQK